MNLKMYGLLAGALFVSFSHAEAQQSQFQKPLAQKPQAFSQTTQQSQGQAKQDIVATVNGDAITKTQLQVKLQSKLQGTQVNPQIAEQYKKQALNELIEIMLIEQHVSKHGPTVTSEEVDSVVTQLKQQLKDQGISFSSYLTTRGQSEKNFKKSVKGSLAWQKFQREKVTPANLHEYFQKNRSEFQVEKFEDAQQDVIQAYMASLWGDILEKQKSSSEIKILSHTAPALPQKTQQPPSSGFPK
ncbi:Chaperone SurA [Gimesia panareensis]|uniref:Chaperone SurA n=1 Tax=Gimesia panareensis TaxID=2527978 RepID=A0A518FWA7_9PLAN|nr:SurA N-terminal domain-containing protein [Gimesia panareensis]QDV20570.1 Chaperone SurA [Gimesia panareensis]